MANVLRVTPQEVNEKAKAITAVKARMEDLLTELDGRIKTMNTEDWIGDAGSTYGNQFVLLYNQVIRSMDTVQQYANNPLMRQTATRSWKARRPARQAAWTRPEFSVESHLAGAVL